MTEINPSLGSDAAELSSAKLGVPSVADFVVMLILATLLFTGLVAGDVTSKLVSSIMLRVSPSRTITIAPLPVRVIIPAIFLWGSLAVLRRPSRGRYQQVLLLTVSFAVACWLILRITGKFVSPLDEMIVVGAAIPFLNWLQLYEISSYTVSRLRFLLEFISGRDSEARRVRPIRNIADDQIDALRDVEFALADARRLWSHILNSFHDPIFVLDDAGAILLANPAAVDFQRRSGLSLERGLNFATILDSLTLSGGDKELTWPPQQTQSGRRSPEGLSTVGTDHDGRTFELSFVSTRSARDEPTGWIVHMTEATLRMSATREREMALRQREEALQLLSHDMRSPQVAILDILSQDDLQGAPGGLRHRIEQQARRTLRLADNFVQLAHAESNAYMVEALDVGRVLEEAVDSVWEMSLSAGVKIRLEPWRGEFIVSADRGLIVRALVNLLDNAVKFSPLGRTVICRLTPATLQGRPAVACAIADQAGGIAEEQHSAIFGRYASFRNAQHGAGGAGGVGLGLSLVQTVVTRHGGVVTCESALGAGSVFTVTLPLYDPGVGPAQVLQTR